MSLMRIHRAWARTALLLAVRVVGHGTAAPCGHFGALFWNSDRRVPACLGVARYLLTLATRFVAWLRAAGRAADRAAAARRGAASAARLLPLGTILPVALAVFALGGCGRADPPTPWSIDGAQAAGGPLLMRQYGCTSCHSIPGVAGARGQVGPSLAQFGRRAYVAGMLRNEPDNLVHWLRAPQSVLPGNAMPDTGVTEQDARDIAAYLYQLQ